MPYKDEIEVCEDEHRPTIEQMQRELISAGWSRWKGNFTVWQAPSGLLFRGPVKAWELMQRGAK